MVVPISAVSLDYARQVRRALRGRRIHVDVDATDRKMQKKVREAQLEQYNYILVRAATFWKAHTPPTLGAGQRASKPRFFGFGPQSLKVPLLDRPGAPWLWQNKALCGATSCLLAAQGRLV